MASRSVIPLLAVLLGTSLYAQSPDFCGPSNEKYKVIRHREHPTPAPSAGKAMIYLLYNGGTGYILKESFAVNGRWVALLPGHSYSYAEVDPGVQQVCHKSPAEKANNFLFLTVEAGKSYYVELARPLRQLAETEGKEHLVKCRYVTMERQR